MADAALRRGAGPHPLPLFLSLLSRRLAAEPERLAAALEGLRRYQDAPRLPLQPPHRPLEQIGGVRLLEVGGPAAGAPVVLVPSLINAPVVLDLAEGRSLARFLADEGHRVLLLDWGRMGPSERRLGLAGLVSLRLLPLLDRLGTGAEAGVRLVGYCLGGTLAMGAAHALGARLGGLALIAAPWHFNGFPHAARLEALETWSTAGPVGRALGAVPVTLLNPLFWALDEEAVVAKFEALARRPADDPGISWFAAVEDWASSGAPIPLPAARDLFVEGFGRDRFGAGRWMLRGRAVRPEEITAPILDFGALSDRIVPPEARLRPAGAARHEVTRHDVHAGHVGMVVGSGARAALWEPLSNWLHAR